MPTGFRPPSTPPSLATSTRWYRSSIPVSSGEAPFGVICGGVTPPADTVPTRPGPVLEQQRRHIDQARIIDPQAQVVAATGEGVVVAVGAP